MTTTATKTTTRRSVSKARLYKEIKAAVTVHKLEDGAPIIDLLDAIKDDIVDEALKT